MLENIPKQSWRPRSYQNKSRTKLEKSINQDFLILKISQTFNILQRAIKCSTEKWKGFGMTVTLPSGDHPPKDWVKRGLVRWTFEWHFIFKMWECSRGVNTYASHCICSFLQENKTHRLTINNSKLKMVRMSPLR